MQFRNYREKQEMEKGNVILTIKWKWYNTFFKINNIVLDQSGDTDGCRRNYKIYFTNKTEGERPK